MKKVLVCVVALLLVLIGSADPVSAAKSKANCKLEERAKCVGVNLIGKDLSGLSLSGTNFSKAQLKNVYARTSNMNGVNFTGANLSGSDFSKTELRNVTWKGATATDVDFTEAEVTNALARGANFSRSNFDGADLSYGDFSSANFNGVRWPGGDLHIFDARFIGANFSGASLNFSCESYNDGYNGADFSKANFSGAKLIGPTTVQVQYGVNLLCGLGKVKFDGANFTNAVLAGVPSEWAKSSFAGAIWNNTTCPDGSVRNTSCF